MTVLEAALQVLAEAGGPLHCEEIARRLQEQGLWRSAGNTPAATVRAALSVEVQRRGPMARLKRIGKGVYALNAASAPAVSPSLGSSPPLAPAAQPHPGVGRASLSFTEAAEEVLSRFAQRQPMHYRKITEKALELGQIATLGSTPEATMRAQLGVEIDRAERRGENPRFFRHGRGLFGLTAWMDAGLAAAIQRQNDKVRADLLNRLRELPPDRFEALVGLLLGRLGFTDIEVTSRSGDGGIDVRGTLVVGGVIRTRMAVQVKRWKGNVQTPTVQQVRGSLGAHEQGLIITTGGFSAGAREDAKRPDASPVGLMAGEDLVGVLVEHEIGVRKQHKELFELASLDLEEES